MNDIVYPLSHDAFAQEEKDAVLKIMENERYTMNGHVESFEKSFAEYFGMKYAVMVNSGSSANLVTTASLFFRKDGSLQKGDEVIVPAISWATTFYPLHQYGLKMKIVDINLETLNYDMDELKKAISSKTKMVVAVSILGNPCRLDELAALCQENNIILFEDNCESMGAKLNGKYTGTFGLVNTFSTFFSHHISTMEGGLILTDDFEIYCLCKALRNHGWTRDQDENSNIFEKKNDDFYEAYRFILPGYNVRPMEIQGALGNVQLAKIDHFLEARRKNADCFRKHFANDERFIIQKEYGQSSWFCFTMILKPEFIHLKNKIFAKLKENGIEFRIITGGSIAKHDVIKYFDCEITKTDNADYAHENGFFVGNCPVDISDKIKFLHQTLKNI